MLSDIYEAISRSPRLKKALGIGAVLLVLAFIASLVLNSATHPEYRLTKTDLNSTTSFAQLAGSKVYAYDGLAFYAINVNDGTQTVLHQGTKLPLTDKVYWANDKGALMTFKGSYTYTPVETAINNLVPENSSDAPQPEKYVWYFDFANGSVTLVSTDELTANLAVYSEKDNGFYYIPNMSRLTFDPNYESAVPLKFFDLATKSSSTVADDLKLTDISSLRTCSQSTYRVCVIGRDTSNINYVTLYGITEDNKKAEIYKTDGRIIATSNPEFVLVSGRFDADAETANENTESREFVDVSSEPAMLYNIAQKKATDLGFRTAQEVVIPYINSPNSGYVLRSNLTADDGIDYLSLAPTILQTLDVAKAPIEYQTGGNLFDGFTEVYSTGDNGLTLINTTKNDVALFGPEGAVKPITKLSYDDEMSAVKACTNAEGLTYDFFNTDNIYRIYFVDGPGLKTDMVDFSKCLTSQKPQSLIGYTFRFMIRDPVNGRIVSD